MEFENLRAIWNTQNERPVYELNDSRLAVGLYQQREQSRRRLLRQQFAPIFLALFVAVGNGWVFQEFFEKTAHNVSFGKADPRMSVWDGVALAAAVIAAAAVAISIYIQRRAHERTQDVFAPSLREELERGVAQLDFELRVFSKQQALKGGTALSFGLTVLFWEFGRLIGERVPWSMLPAALSVYPICAGYFAVNKKIRQRVMERRRALETMLAQLNKEELGS